MHAWAEVCHLLQSSKSPLTGFLCSIGTSFLQTLPAHTNSTSNSAILRNNYILLLGDFCACVHMKKKWHHKGSHSSSMSDSNHLTRFQTYKKWWVGALLSGKCCCFVWKPSRKSRKFELAHPKKKKEKFFGCLATFWFNTFMMFSIT